VSEVRQEQELRAAGHLDANDENRHPDHTHAGFRRDLLRPGPSKAEPYARPGTKEDPEKRDTEDERAEKRTREDAQRVRQGPSERLKPVSCDATRLGRNRSSPRCEPYLRNFG
jgi:hypothetical protein